MMREYNFNYCTYPMLNLAKNLITALQQPGIGLEYLGWALKKNIRTEPPTRRVGDVILGNFTGFSEYHSAASFSRHEVTFLNTYELQPGDIIDVGANLGLFSLIMARRYPDRPIYAVEPNPSTATTLRSNIQRNLASNVHAHQSAIADQIGEISFCTRENARACASLVTEARSEYGDAIPVACTTLDAFVRAQGVTQIALLKVDVEGFETLVFRGAVDYVMKHVRPAVIFFEVCPPLSVAAGFRPSEPAELLLADAYRLFRFNHTGELIATAPDAAINDVVENWLAVDTLRESSHVPGQRWRL